MATVNRWDEDQYRDNMNAVGALYEAARELSNFMQQHRYESFTAGGINYDPTGRIHSGVKRFITAAGRVHNLHESMKVYLQEYTGMLANAQGTMENIGVENNVYGMFGSLVAGGTALASVYENSFAYQMYNTQLFGSGQNYYDRYNDTQSFVTSKFFSRAMDYAGQTELSNYGLYFNFLTGNNENYGEDLLKTSLAAMLDDMPDAVNIRLDNIDWDTLGSLLGVENLAELCEPLDAILKEFRKGGKLSDEQVKRLEAVIKNIQDQNGLPPGMLKMLDKLLPFLEKGEILLGPGVDMFNVWVSFFNTYTVQLSYLDTIENTLLTAGTYYGTPISGVIDDMRREYSDVVFGAMDEVFDLAGWAVGDILTYSVPLLKNVDFGLEAISISNELLYGVDRVAAVKDMMGIMQYSQTLTNSCKYYADMMEQGVASAADVAEANRLFEMLHATKIREYEAIKTITAERVDLPEWMDKETEADRWYDLACEKLEELKKIDPSDPKWWKTQR